ncbi:MAG: GNAT family N-acetyltransferase [Alphaproteobacteria bacterium]|nr:GNAT family N-acetyltransferase [Alphaproteobacteria bacterium]
MSDYRIRDGKLPEDAEIGSSFIFGLQQFERAMEDDRRVDATVGAEFFDVLAQRVAEKQGRIFIAEDASGAAIGWAACFVEENEIYVEPDLRRFGYISELYLVEHARGRGIGKALIAKCETYFRTLGLKLMMIGVLSRNTSARRSYVAAGFRPYSEMLQKLL